MIYFSEEDSFLIQKHPKIFSKGRVLDVGTGSGILAETAMRNTKDVIAVDIDDESVKYAKSKGINAIKSDLFSNVKGKFDVIIFNPPYLPSSKYKDIALDGGKKGYEVIERFLKQAKDYLTDNGIILMVYSSFSKPRKIKQIMKQNGFEEEILEEKKLSFERLSVVRIKRKVF